MDALKRAKRRFWMAMAVTIAIAALIAPTSTRIITLMGSEGPELVLCQHQICVYGYLPSQPGESQAARHWFATRCRFVWKTLIAYPTFGRYSPAQSNRLAWYLS